MDRIIDAVHVRRLPEVFEQGNLYVADDPPVAGHLCCCGCGERIVLSIGPLGWKYTEKAGRPSLSPMIGNLGLPCDSRYAIRDGEVIWA